MFHFALNGYDIEVILMALENMYDSIQEAFSIDVYEKMASFRDVNTLISYFKNSLEKVRNNNE